MGATDGEVLQGATRKIHDSGPDEDMWNLVLLGDGYTKRDLEDMQKGPYARDAKAFRDQLLSAAPFNEAAYGKRINIHCVFVRSDECGADFQRAPYPEDCQPAVPHKPATFFDATFGDDVVDRLLTACDVLSMQVAIDQVPKAHHAVVLVNTPNRGGSAPVHGFVAVTSAAYMTVGIHELGRSWFSLVDEYPYLAGSGVDEPSNRRFPDPEPVDPNVSTQVTIQGHKWENLIRPGTPMPTVKNRKHATKPECSQCDEQFTVPAAAQGLVGTFEGAGHFRCGLYRGEQTCCMKNDMQPFCRVCQQAIRNVLATRPG